MDIEAEPASVSIIDLTWLDLTWLCYQNVSVWPSGNFLFLSAPLLCFLFRSAGTDFYETPRDRLVCVTITSYCGKAAERHNVVERLRLLCRFSGHISCVELSIVGLVFGPNRRRWGVLIECLALICRQDNIHRSITTGSLHHLTGRRGMYGIISISL